MNTLQIPINGQNPFAPVTLISGLIMGLITLMYTFGQLQSLPCDQDLGSAFLRNFIHVDWLHLILNMYTFYRLMPIELIFGSSFYLILLGFLILFQTIIEWIINLYFEINCSIGFSGILFGLFTWMILSLRGQDWKMLSALILSIFASSARDPRLSLLGHLMGVVSGLLAWAISTPFLLTSPLFMLTKL